MIEGITFDHLDTAALSKYFNVTSGSGQPAVVSSTGRGSTKALEVGLYGSLSKTFAATDTPMFCGGFTLPALPSFGQIHTLVSFYDSSTLQCRVIIYGDGTLAFQRGITTVGSPSTWAALPNVYYGFCVAPVIHSSTGEVDIYIAGNPTPIITLSGVNTQATANPSVNSWRLGASSGDGTMRWKDVCWDVDGVFPGDPKVTYQVGTSDSVNDLTPSTGSDAYPLLDDIPPSMTDKVSGVGKVLLGFPALPVHPESILAVGTEVLINKDDTGDRFWNDLYETGATEYSGTPESMSTDELLLVQWRHVDPDTGIAWTEAGLNDFRQGFEIT